MAKATAPVSMAFALISPELLSIKAAIDISKNAAIDPTPFRGARYSPNLKVERSVNMTKSSDEILYATPPTPNHLKLKAASQNCKYG